jgi:GT2 family glycosyltransferase
MNTENQNKQNDVAVAVILLNYNSTKFTIDCINSIFDKTAPKTSFQIIVVDNNSMPSERNKLRSFHNEHSNFTLIENKVNVGFAGGNMIGANYVNADYYYFLNNDCYLLNDCINILYNFCQDDSKVALCSGLMYNEQMKIAINYQYHPTPLLKWVGSTLLRLFNNRKYSFSSKIYEEPTKVEVLSGSSLFVRAEYFKEVGGFDTTYFLYCEEEDLAWKLRHYDCYVVPDAKFQHLHHKSTVINHDIRKEFYISFLYYYEKNFGSLSRILMQVLLFLKNFRKFYKDISFLKLSLFILKGAPLKESLRHKQVPRNDLIL